MAQAVISRAEADGRSKPGDTVVEYTGGSTGASLALVCAAKGYRLRIVSSDAFSREKLDQMAALGAELTLVPSEGGRTTKKLILDMIETARRLSQEPHTYWTDQLNNHDSIAGYYPLGEEIWSQTKGEVDAFVHSVGTAASSRGVATVLKRYKPSIKIVAVEPAESAVLSGGEPGPHKIEGVGIGYRPPLWEPSLVDEIVPVRTDDAKEMARRLAREEGVFAGTSSGANVIASIQVARAAGPGCQGGHADGGLGPEVPGHRRLPAGLAQGQQPDRHPAACFSARQIAACTRRSFIMNVWPTGRTVGRSSAVIFVSSMRDDPVIDLLAERAAATPRALATSDDRVGDGRRRKPGKELRTREQLPAVAAQQAIGPESSGVDARGAGLDWASQA